MQTYKLWEIAKVFAWSSAPQEEKYFVDWKYPFLRTGDLWAAWTTNNLIKINDYINDLCVEECSVTFAKKWTLVFPKSWQSVNTNKKGILWLDSYVVSHLCCIDSWNETTNKFIYYFFCTRNLSDRSDNDAYPSLKLEIIKQIQLPLPPLATQRAIADKLDKLQSLIDLKKQAITKTDELAKSIFLEMFGDPMKNEKGREMKLFGEVIKIDAKMVDPKKEQYESLLHVWGANIESETWKLLNLKTAKQEGIISLKFLISPNHILFSKIRPKLKKICYPKMTALCSADIYPMTVSEEQLNQHYLMYYLLWDEFTSIVSEIAEKRAQIPKVNREELEQIKIPLPPLPLQQKFADIITQIESQKSEHKLALAKLEELYQATMQESFSL